VGFRRLDASGKSALATPEGIAALDAFTKVLKDYGPVGVANFGWEENRLLPGEIHALLGENGTGKSTLTKVMAGVYPLSSGKLFIDGREERLSTPPRVSRRASPWSTRRTAWSHR
jgi:ABC-type sugar transport system ATPase subunit